MIKIETLTTPSLNDLEQILAIYHAQAWWPETITDPQRVRRAISGSHCYMVARDKARIVGIGRALSDGVGDAYIHDITVIPEYRKQGIATEIVRMIVARLKKDGLTWMGLIAEPGSPALYEKFGFSPLAKCTPMFSFTTDPQQDS